MTAEATVADQPAPDPDTGRMFPQAKPMLTLDEHDPDILRITIGGTVELDRTNEKHVALFRALRIGSRHSLLVDAFVAGRVGPTAKVDRDDNVSDYVLAVKLKVEDLDLYDPAADS